MRYSRNFALREFGIRTSTPGMDVAIVMEFFVRASGGQALQLPCNADTAKPRLVDFLRFLDQDVRGTDRQEVS